MTNRISILTRTSFILLITLLLASSSSLIAQETSTGDWHASIDRESSERIHLSMELHSETTNKHKMGSNFAFADLQGLSREQAVRGGPTRFSMAREAGTIEFEGSFGNGKGSGTFRFTASRAFVAAMKSRGFDFEKETANRTDLREHENRLFAATALNITTALADDLLSADFGKLDVDDLFKCAIFKVDSKFMREMKASGYPGLSMEDLVKARIFRVDADFVAQVTQMGFDKEPFETLVKMRIFKVTPEFVAEARNEGLNNLTIEELVKLRIFNIDSDFIRRARAEGTPIEVDALVERRIGVRGLR